MKTETKELAKEMYAAMNGAVIEDTKGFIERTVLKGINMTADGDMTENGKAIAHVEKRPDYKGKPQEPTVWDAGDWELYQRFERNLTTAADLKSILHVGYAEKVIEQVVDGVKKRRMEGELEKFVEHESVSSWKPDGEPVKASAPYPEPVFTEPKKPEPKKAEPPKAPKPEDGMHNGMTWKERAEVGLKIARESGGRIKAEWKGRNVETAWLWLRAADGVEGTNPFTKAEAKQLKHKGGAGFRYKKYGEGAQYEEGTVMWYLPYPNTMKHRMGKGHKQYKTFEEEEAA